MIRLPCGLRLSAFYGTADKQVNVTSLFLSNFYAHSANTIVINKQTHFNKHFGDVVPNVAKTLTVSFNSYKLVFPEITTEFFSMATNFPCQTDIFPALSTVFPLTKPAHLFDFFHSNQYICERIKSKEPFCIARLGNSEVEIIMKRSKIDACRHVGVSPPTDAEMDAFSIAYTNALLKSDCCLVFERPFIEYYLDVIKASCPRYSANVTCEGHHNIMFPAALFYPDFWFHLLEGHRVLLITPLKESIPQQHNKKFYGNAPYPQFESLEILESPLTQSDLDDDYHGEPWSSHYARLCQELTLKDFDIALIGAGGYGLPLAAECKRLGKQAILLGGVLQLFFGVIGKRWIPRLRSAQCNIDLNNWITPTESERPANWKKIEDGCYW